MLISSETEFYKNGLNINILKKHFVEKLKRDIGEWKRYTDAIAAFPVVDNISNLFRLGIVCELKDLKIDESALIKIVNMTFNRIKIISDGEKPLLPIDRIYNLLFFIRHFNVNVEKSKLFEIDCLLKKFEKKLYENNTT